MSIINRLWKWLVKPSADIEQEDKRQQAEIVSTLLLGTLFITSLYLLSILILKQGPLQGIQLAASIITSIILLTAYLVSRTRWYETAVLIFAIGFGWVISCSLEAAPTRLHLVAFFVLPVLLSSMVVSIKYIIGVITIEGVAILYLLLIHPDPRFWENGGVIVLFYLLVSALTLVIIHHKNKIEEARHNQLLQNEARMQQYFDDASDWLFSLDSQGKVTWVNKEVCRVLGYSAEEIVGQKPIRFISAGNVTRIQETLQQLLSGKDIPFIEAEIKDKNGRPVWLEVRGRKVKDGDKVIGTFHIARDITERKTAEKALNQLTTELKQLYNANQQLGQSLNLEHIYETIHNILSAVMDGEFMIISTYSSDDQMIRCVYACFQGEKPDINLFPPLRLKEKGKGGQSDIIHNGEARIVNNFPDYVSQSHVYEIDNSECTADPDADKMPRSAIYAPIKYNEQVLGVIQLHSNRPNAYTEYHLRFLTALSPQIAAAMTNATLYKQARQRQAIAETLSQSVMVLNSSLALEDVLDHILEYYHRVIPFDSASIQQKEGDHLIIKAARGFRNDAKLIGFNFGLDDDLPNVHVLRTRKPMALVNVRETYPYFAELADEYQASNIYSWLGVPLIVDDVVIGMITIDRTERRPFTPEEITLSMTFANHASIAFRNAALYSELETHNERLERAVAARTAELQRTTDQIQIIIDNSPDAILLLGADRTIEQCNPAFGQMFQYASQDVLGKRPCDLIATAEEKIFEQMMETAVANQTTCRLSTIVKTQDGRPLEVDAALVPILENNQIVGIVCSLHDISGYKEIERMKDAFVSNVSHELRTPIANLRLHHDLLSLNPGKRDIYMARLGREINRLTNIIEDLLRISRLDQKRITINLVTLDLVQLAEQYLNDRQALAAQKQLTLTIQTETAVPPIQGDPRLLEQVIGIILTNAMNYTPPNGTITITPVHDHRQGQEWAGLRISDTGAGIPDNERDHIFERFYRGYIALESGQPGTGLGLAIAQEIIHIHQGRIELDAAKPGEGAAFIIWLPANAPETST